MNSEYSRASVGAEAWFLLPKSVEKTSITSRSLIFLTLFVWCSHDLSLCCRTDMQRGGFDSLVHSGTSCRERRRVRDISGKALRVIPRGKQRLTVYRAHQVWFSDIKMKISHNPWIRFAWEQFFQFRLRVIQKWYHCVRLCAVAKYMMAQRFFMTPNKIKIFRIYRVSRKSSGSV